MRQLENLGNAIYQRDSMSEPPVQRSQPTCILQPYPGPANKVSIHSLEVPEKVQSEYNKACIALRSQKPAESEKHLRKALQHPSPDALGWVMLGRVLEFGERFDEAREACSQAVLHEPSYWPATVCLAELDAQKQKWTDALEESNRAVSLSQESKRFAYYISALALYNLNKLGEAESRALEAEKLDGAYDLLPLRLLLARIDETKGDRQGAVAQLRDCLSKAQNAPEGKLAKQELAWLEGGRH
jgi:tetratricopeptide (TPR) repeat protein